MLSFSSLSYYTLVLSKTFKMMERSAKTEKCLFWHQSINMPVLWPRCFPSLENSADTSLHLCCLTPESGTDDIMQMRRKWITSVKVPSSSWSTVWWSPRMHVWLGSTEASAGRTKTRLLNDSEQGHYCRFEEFFLNCAPKAIWPCLDDDVLIVAVPWKHYCHHQR